MAEGATRRRAAARWLLKTPQHLHALDVLCRVFQRAQVVLTHRDPAQTIPSMASMAHTLWQMYADDPDPLAVGAQWNAGMARAIGAAMAARDALPADRFLDVRFEDTVSNPLGVAEAVYAFAGMPLDARQRAAMTAWMARNGRDKRAALFDRALRLHRCTARARLRRVSCAAPAGSRLTAIAREINDNQETTHVAEGQDRRDFRNRAGTRREARRRGRARGARGVVVAARTLEKLDDAEARIHALGVDCDVLKVQTDITDRAQCRQLATQAVERFGRIDALVNSAFVHGRFRNRWRRPTSTAGARCSTPTCSARWRSRRKSCRT